jgi:hypothetical protein
MEVFMRRRDLLKLPFVTALSPSAKPQPPQSIFDGYFLKILNGYLENAHRTSPSFAVCDFAGGTILKGAVAKSGKTYDSVSRMLPALAAWVAADKKPGSFRIGGETIELIDILRMTFQNAFDPNHPDYWLPAPPDQQNQRQVEASIVAWSLWLLGDTLLAGLSSQQRANIQAWLQSCTQVPVRRNNWAWFTAVNQAVRLDLSRQWKEFSGDAGWMVEDLKALDKMALPDDGWYSDSLTEPVYDYYNFWVFASHFLYWNRVIGSRYRDWSSRFGKRLKDFLKKTPYFFGSNGSHVLFGRSLIYRWAVLTPLVLAYQQDMWPHSAGLLRRIVRGNLEYLWNLGAFDEQHGKLRETLSPSGTREICESYIDNGHPYWGMQAYALFLIPERDSFWRDREEPLEVERHDFEEDIDAPRMKLVGWGDSGHVRWLHAVTGHNEPRYRDKYTKFSYSSHFPFNVIQSAETCPWDAALVFRDPKTGVCAGRAGTKNGELDRDGMRVAWWAQLGDFRFEVTTEVVIFQEFEHRKHVIVAPADAVTAGIEVLDGSYALGVEQGEHYEGSSVGLTQYIRAVKTGYAIWSTNHSGFQEIEPVEFFDKTKRGHVNIVYPRMVVNTLRAALRQERTTVESLHYASPKPMPRADIQREGRKRLSAIRRARIEAA